MSVPELVTKCAHCGGEIKNDREVFVIFAKLMPGMSPRSAEGGFIELQLIYAERYVPVIVVAQNSDAKRDGYDLIFQACSQKCVNDLHAILQQETSMFEGFRIN